MHKIILFLLFSVAACQSKPSASIWFEKKQYSAEIERVNQIISIKSDFFNGKNKIDFKLDESSGQAYLSRRFEYDENLVAGTIEGPIDTVMIAPYFGLFSLKIISGIREEGRAIQSAMCPIDTKYLMVIFFYMQRLPYVGCVIENKVEV